MSRLLVATTNRGKLAELSPLLARHGWELVGLDAFPGVAVAREDEPDFAGNARSKALHYAAATGLPALADDSGLEVAALGGAPGVRSARYAGPGADDAANRARLLAELAGVTDRRARFTCALCLAEPVAGAWSTGAGAEAGTRSARDRSAAVRIEVQGACTGRIAEAPRGTGGFGYDALFVCDDPAARGATFAELSREAKSRLSHRGAALRALEAALAGENASEGAAVPGPSAPRRGARAP